MVSFIIYRILAKHRIIKRIARTRMFYVVLFFVTTWFVNGLLFYYSEHIFAGREEIDIIASLYWSIITMATIGYGDITPVRGLGWLVAGFSAVMGILAYTLTVSVIADWFLSKSIRRSLGRAPLKNKKILVIGDSDSCREIIDELIANNYLDEVGWVTPREPRSISDVDFLVGDPSNAEVLKRAGIEKAEHVFLCLRDDSRTIHTTLLIKYLNPNINIYAVASDSKTEELVRAAGAKTVISTRMLGRTITSALFEPGVLLVLSDIISARGKGDLIQIKINKKLERKTIREIEEILNQDKKYRYRIIAYVKTNNEYIIAPNPETTVHENESLVAVKGEKENTT
ncbi:potassium channel family protein [Staphylothermus marinus]|nr:NAD-binding protein [Staphylothermus marinus]